MTRNEAAAFLDVEPQTITNWVKKGLLAGYNNTTSRRFYVNADDVYKFSEKYKLLAVSEETFNTAIHNLERKIKEVDTQLEYMMKVQIKLSTFDREKMDSLIQYFIDKVLEPQSQKDASVLRMFIHGMRIRDIADYCGITESRVRTLIGRGLKKLVGGMKSYKELKEENASLRETIAQKEKEIAKVKDYFILRMGQLQASKKIEKEGPEVPEIFRQNLEDCGIPNRALHCLRAAEVYTMGDLVTWKEEDLLKLPFMGKKTVAALKKILASKGLKLDMPIASVYASGKEFLNMEVSDVIQQKISEIALFCKNKYGLTREEAMDKTLEEMQDYINRRL